MRKAYAVAFLTFLLITWTAAGLWAQVENAEVVGAITDARPPADEADEI